MGGNGAVSGGWGLVAWWRVRHVSVFTHHQRCSEQDINKASSARGLFFAGRGPETTTPIDIAEYARDPSRFLLRPARSGRGFRSDRANSYCRIQHPDSPPARVGRGAWRFYTQTNSRKLPERLCKMEPFRFSFKGLRSGASGCSPGFRLGRFACRGFRTSGCWRRLPRSSSPWATARGAPASGRRRVWLEVLWRRTGEALVQEVER